MILTKPSFMLNYHNGMGLVQDIELIGRVCYRSEDKKKYAGMDSLEETKEFIGMLIKSGHESVLEHRSLTALIICDRGVSHELVRHRIASFSQESTRYCNYSKNGNVVFIIPPWISWKEGMYTDKEMVECLEPVDESAEPTSDQLWLHLCRESERTYLRLLAWGWKPQQARAVLPNSLSTKIAITTNLREWRHILRLRALGTAGTPHPQMREIMLPLLKKLRWEIPVVFEDIYDAAVAKGLYEQA